MCDHSHGGHCCHSLEISDPSAAFGLYRFINVQNVECLNESIAGSGRSVFKPYEDRKDASVFVESDADEELLFNIPFTGTVKIQGIIISGDCPDAHPRMITLYKNKPFMTFADTNVEGEQTVDLIYDPFGEVVYPLKVVRFASVHTLSIHVRKSFSSEKTKLHYIGLRGQFSAATRKEIVIANYELKPNIADHKADIINPTSHLVE